MRRPTGARLVRAPELHAGDRQMEAENSFHAGGVEARGALCVECLRALDAEEGVLDRTGAALCRACASEFYAACAACGGLVPRDEALAREGGGDAAALYCFECFGKSASPEGEDAPTDEEVAAMVAEYVALHEESKRLDARANEIKERLKLAARARPRVSNAVVLRAGDAGVRCSFASKTSYDAEKLSEAETLLGAEEFASLFERKVSFSAVKDRLEEFLSSNDDARAHVRDAVRAAENRTEVATLTVVAQKEGKSKKAKDKKE
jgi:hypothetical protein